MNAKTCKSCIRFLIEFFGGDEQQWNNIIKLAHKWDVDVNEVINNISDSGFEKNVTNIYYGVIEYHVVALERQICDLLSKKQNEGSTLHFSYDNLLCAVEELLSDVDSFFETKHSFWYAKDLNEVLEKYRDEFLDFLADKSIIADFSKGKIYNLIDENLGGKK